MKKKCKINMAIRVLLLAGLLLAQGCKLNDSTEAVAGLQSGLDGEPATRQIIDAPYLKNFVGAGYDLLTIDKQYKGKALDIDTSVNSTAIVLDNIKETMMYDTIFIMNSTDMQKVRELSFNGSINSGNAFGGVSVGAEFSYESNSEELYSGKSVFILVLSTYIYGTAKLDRANFKPGIMDLYNNDKNAFYDMYGHGYVERAVIGESLYYLYTFSLTKDSKMSMTELKVELNAKFLGMEVEGGFSKKDLDEFRNENIEIRRKLYTNGFIPPSNLVAPEDDTQIVALLSSFTSYLNNLYTNAESTNDFSKAGTLGIQFRSYEKLMNDIQNQQTYLSDVDEYYLKLMGWWKIKSKLCKVYNDLNDNALNVPYSIKLDTLNKIRAKLDEIKIEMDRCSDRNAAARYPDNPLPSDWTELIIFEETQPDVPAQDEVISPDNVRVSWIKKGYFDHYDVYVDKKKVGTTNRAYYDLGTSSPGLHEWYVTGAYGSNGIHFDSTPRNFLVPGFDMTSCLPNNSFVNTGTTSVWVDTAYGMLDNDLYRNGTKYKDVSGSKVSVYMPTPGEIYNFHITGENNGTSADSHTLTYITKDNNIRLVSPWQTTLYLPSRSPRERTLTATKQSGYTYTWSISPGLQLVSNTQYYNEMRYKIRGLTVGKYWVRLTRRKTSTGQVDRDVVMVYVC